MDKFGLFVSMVIFHAGLRKMYWTTWGFVSPDYGSLIGTCSRLNVDIHGISLLI